MISMFVGPDAHIRPWRDVEDAIPYNYCAQNTVGADIIRPNGSPWGELAAACPQTERGTAYEHPSPSGFA